MGKSRGGNEVVTSLMKPTPQSLRDFRKSQNLTQEEMAHCLGSFGKHAGKLISKYERGAKDISEMSKARQWFLIALMNAYRPDWWPYPELPNDKTGD